MLLNEVIYIIYSLGFVLENKSSFNKSEAISDIMTIFSRFVEEKAASDKLDKNETVKFKTEMITSLAAELGSMKKAELWEYLNKKRIMYQSFEEIVNIILTDKTKLDLLINNEQELFAFLDNFPNLYYESVSDANELLGSFHINYHLKFLFEKGGYLLGCYDGIVTSVEYKDFDGSTPYLKYYEFGLEDVKQKKILKPNYVIFSPHKYDYDI